MAFEIKISISKEVLNLDTPLLNNSGVERQRGHHT